jgi:hypothetical protein
LVAFYTEHNPDGLGKVDNILQQCSVRQIKDGMQQKYGNIPDVTVIPKAKGALSKLDISSNNIEGGALQRIIELCDTNSIELIIESESDGESGSAYYR